VDDAPVDPYNDVMGKATVAVACRHPICELIGDGACSIASGKSRGCTPGLAAKTIERAVFDEVRTLLAAIARGDRDAASRLGAIVRREAREDRNLLVQARDDEPELATELARLLVRP
jgi:hypothetical protein